MKDNAPLLAFIDQLRSRGVRSFKGPFDEAVIEMELGPAVVPEVPTGKSEEPDLCKCGCKTYEHNNGLCLRGCQPEACAPEAQ